MTTCSKGSARARVSVLLVLWVALCLWVPLWGQYAESEEFDGEQAIWTQEQLAQAFADLRSGEERRSAAALKALKRMAVDGEVKAQHLLGMVYLYGMGVESNAEQAIRWFEQASEQRYPMSMIRFAELLVTGESDADYDRALPILREIVDAKSRLQVSPEDFGAFREAKSRANYLLGLMYVNGWGVEKDEPEAIKCFTASAHTGDRDATMYLAIAYAKGDGVEKDLSQAKEYFQLLDLQSSNALNQEIESKMAESRDQTDRENMLEQSSQMNKAISETIYALQTQFAKDVLQEEGDGFDASFAASLLELASEGGDAEAKLYLGVLKHQGLGTDMDLEQAGNLFREAMDDGGFALARYNLAVMLQDGEILGQEDGEVGRFLESAAEFGLFVAQARLDGEKAYGVMNPEDARDICLEKAREEDARAIYSLAKRKSIGWLVELEPDRTTLTKLYHKAADAGYSRAQYMMGFLKMTGVGTRQDSRAGFSWLRNAAFQGHMGASYFLGRCYAEGIGTEPDLREAFRHFSKAADLGFGPAKNALAVFYNNGIGVVKNEWKATELYLEAADEGDAQAAQNIGNSYLLGRGVPMDLEEGLRWISLSADQGNLAACYQMAYIYSEGLLVDRDETEVAFWREKAARLGDRASMKLTALSYFYGDGNPRNRGKALYWMNQYIESSEPALESSLLLRGEFEDFALVKKLLPEDYSALMVLADLKSEAGWSGSDMEEALKIYQRLANWGFRGPALRLAKIHVASISKKSNPRKGYELYRSLYEQNKNAPVGAGQKYAAEAALGLSRCYRDGLGVKQSAKREISWLNQAANLGQMEALYELGMMYLTGNDVSEDRVSGVRWLMQAARQGHKQAKLRIAMENLDDPIRSLDEGQLIDWLKELVDSGSGEARVLLRRYGVPYKEEEIREERSPDDRDGNEEPKGWRPTKAA